MTLVRQSLPCCPRQHFARQVSEAMRHTPLTNAQWEEGFATLWPLFLRAECDEAPALRALARLAKAGPDAVMEEKEVMVVTGNKCGFDHCKNPTQTSAEDKKPAIDAAMGREGMRFPATHLRREDGQKLQVPMRYYLRQCCDEPAAYIKECFLCNDWSGYHRQSTACFREILDENVVPQARP